MTATSGSISLDGRPEQPAGAVSPLDHHSFSAPSTALGSINIVFNYPVWGMVTVARVTAVWRHWGIVQNGPEGLKPRVG